MNVVLWLLKSVSTVTAILALLAILPWLLGTPGVSGNAYARGWSIGLQAILAYPVVFVGLVVFRWIAARNWIPVPTNVVDALIWGAFLAFVIAQIFAWRLILR